MLPPAARGAGTASASASLSPAAPPHGAAAQPPSLTAAGRFPPASLWGEPGAGGVKGSELPPAPDRREERCRAGSLLRAAHATAAGAPATERRAEGAKPRGGGRSREEGVKNYLPNVDF